MRTDPRKQEFARRLEAAMDVKGMGAAELARRVQAILPKGNKFRHPHIAQYRRGLAIPRRRYLDAICAVLEVEPSDLIPADDYNTSAQRTALWAARQSQTGVLVEHYSEEAKVSVKDCGNGSAWLHFHQKLPWPVVLQILQLLQHELEDADGTASDTPDGLSG